MRAGSQDTGPLAQRIHQHHQMARRATRRGLAAFALLAAQLGMVEGGLVDCIPVPAVRVLLHVCARGELRGRAGSRDGERRSGDKCSAVLSGF